MLELSGQRGYRHVRVSDLAASAGGTRPSFYQRFSGMEDCYLEAHRVEGLALCERLAVAGRGAGDWPLGSAAALRELAGYLETETDRAAGLVVAVRSVGPRAEAQRLGMLALLAHALDRARRDPAALGDPPAITAELVVHAVEQTAVTALRRGEPARFRSALPDLARLGVVPFFGEAAGERAADAVRD